MSEYKNHAYKHALLHAQLARLKTIQQQEIDPFIGHQVGQYAVTPNTNFFKKGIFIASAIVIAHSLVWYAAQQLPTPTLEIKKPEPVVIEIVKPLPKEEPPKVIEPEIPPIVKKVEIPPVVQKPQPVAEPIAQPIQKVEQPKPIQQKPVQQETPQPKVVEQVTPQPAVAESVKPVPITTPKPAAEPSPPAQENLPVTEAKGYAGYLSNPAPEYPEIALERGWEGAVLLRVKVATNGSPLSVEVKHGSGKKVLDDAAIRTVKRWKFSPAMRGNTPIEGWVDVPINYQLPA